MKVACLQLHPRFGDIQGNMARAERSVREAAALGVTLAVLPELYPSGYTMTSRQEARELAEEIPSGLSVRRLEALARETGCLLVMGLAELAGPKIYNSCVAVGPGGLLAVYRKIHLFFKESEWFDAGEEPPPVLDAGGMKLGLMICFDWIFPEAARTLALQGAQILCHPSNLVLPYAQQGMLTRSLENRVFALTCNRIGREGRGGLDLTFTGCSQITGPRGELLARAASDREEILAAEIDPAEALDKRVTELNDLLRDRRPDVYRI